MSNATERLRALLDERGVEHRDATPDILHDVTNWVTKAWLADGRWFRAIETQKGDLTLELFGYSPEQAIEATLGRGECELKRANWDDGTCTWGCICSACDAHLEHETGIGYSFCPHCGARVVRA